MGALLARVAPNLLPGLGAFLNPWVLLILAASLGTAFACGVRVESWHRDSAEKSTAEAWAKTYVDQVEKFRTSAALTTAALEMQRKTSAADEAAWKERLKNAKRPLGTCTAAAPGQPAGAAAVLLTSEFVGLLNDAWKIGLPAARDPAGPDGTAGGSDSVSPERVLGNVKDNAKLCNGFREIIRGWQDLARRNGWVRSP